VLDHNTEVGREGADILGLILYRTGQEAKNGYLEVPYFPAYKTRPDFSLAILEK
jgi:hypothetical protein